MNLGLPWLPDAPSPRAQLHLCWVRLPRVGEARPLQTDDPTRANTLLDFGLDRLPETSAPQPRPARTLAIVPLPPGCWVPDPGSFPRTCPSRRAPLVGHVCPLLPSHLPRPRALLSRNPEIPHPGPQVVTSFTLLRASVSLHRSLQSAPSGADGVRSADLRRGCVTTHSQALQVGLCVEARRARRLLQPTQNAQPCSPCGCRGGRACASGLGARISEPVPDWVKETCVT